MSLGVTLSAEFERIKQRANQTKAELLVPVGRIENSILLIRGQKVMLDVDLSKLYGVTTGNLNKAVKRNIERFPQDFMFQLTKQGFQDLKFHFGSSSWGGRRTAPIAFTEQGVAMLSSVLRSRRAVKVNIAIMRTFVRIREMLSSHEQLSRRLDALEEDYDSRFKEVFQAIRQLMAPPTEDKKKRRIGFRRRNEAD